MSKITRFLGLERIPEMREDAPIRPAQGAGVMPPPRSDRDVLTTDTAMGLSSVYRAISIISGAVSQLSIDVWRGNKPLDPKPALLRKPDVDTHLSAFLESTTTSLATSGNAYWKLDRNARNEVTNARVLNPWECTLNANGTLAWLDKTLKKSDFQHLSLLRVPGRLEGLGPIQAAQRELQGNLDLSNYASGWFVDGDAPSGILKSDQVLSQDQAEQYKAAWQSRGKYEVAVLGNGLDYTPVLLNPKDAQFLENQQFSITGVARLFGIPAHLFLATVEGGSQTYANIAQADLAFVRWTLTQYLREIETAFSLILPGAQTARFNLDALLRPDTKTRYEAHKIAIDAGFLTIEEVRQIEGLE